MKPEPKKAEMPPVPVNRMYTEIERLQMKKYFAENVKIEVEKMLTLKCPRCYKYDGIDENFMKMCDGCCQACLEGADTLVQMGRLTLEERETLVSGIKTAQLEQLNKYKILGRGR